MINRYIAPGLIAGAAAGFCVAVLQFLLTQPLIVEAEVFEAAGALLAGHADAVAEAGHAHASEAAAFDLSRNLITALFLILTYCGFGLILVAAMRAAEALDGRTVQAGLLWGLAGFAAVAAAPAIGLPPELPGMPAAAIEDRQLWWALTVAATSGGIALLAFGRLPLLRLAALALIAAPHLVGAPAPPEDALSSVPPHLAASFVARVLVVGLTGWLILGYLLQRLLTSGDDPSGARRRAA